MSNLLEYVRVDPRQEAIRAASEQAIPRIIESTLVRRLEARITYADAAGKTTLANDLKQPRLNDRASTVELASCSS